MKHLDRWFVLGSVDIWISTRKTALSSFLASRRIRTKCQHGMVILVLFVSLALGACNLANPLAGETASDQGMEGTGESMGDMEGMAMGNELPSDLDTSSTLMTEQETYQVSIHSNLDPIAINQIHTWNLHVETPEGQPVESAEITVGGGMPQHNHGFPTSPQVTKDLGGGDYLVEGIKFSMAGWWEMSFDITADGQTDSVTFNMVSE